MLEAIKTTNGRWLAELSIGFPSQAILQTILESLTLDSQEEAQLLDYIRKKIGRGLFEFTQTRSSGFDDFAGAAPSVQP